MQFPMYFWIGSLRIHPHFLFESIAYGVAFRLLLRRVKTDTLPPSQRSSVILGGMVGALLGAKGLVVLQHLDLLLVQPLDGRSLLLLLLQGKTVVGALLGGLVGVELTKKWMGVTQSTGDAFVYPLIIGTAIGRIGCFLTGLSDRTYGTATTLPWGVDFGDGVLRHPTQLYEILFLLGLLALLRWRTARHITRGLPVTSGELFQLYLIAYLSFRVLIDFIKPEFHPLWGISAIQIACLLGLLYYRRAILDLILRPLVRLIPN